MKVIVAGSRSVWSYPVVRLAIRAALAAWGAEIIEEVVSGCAPGVDRLGEEWASDNGIPVARFKADWEKHGKAAGMIRNREMAAYADALVAIWDGKSRGTKNMIETMKKLGKPVFVAAAPESPK